MTSVSAPPWPAAASSLLDRLLAGEARPVEVARTRLSVHYETGHVDVPVLCVAVPEAVRLPNALVTARLPVGPVRIVGGGLLADGPDHQGARWQVTRWWRPARPSGLAAPPGGPDLPSGGRARRDPRTLDPHALLGAGEGLTPSGDDLLAGALVTAHATADPRLEEWRSATRDALRTRRTTAVSRGLLHHALDGWCIPQLADLLTALCTDPRRVDAAQARLLAVGHSSGRALLDGVRRTLDTRPSTHPSTHPCQGAA